MADGWNVGDTEHPPVDLLRPYDADKMTAYPVDPRVGNVRNNDPGLCEAYQSYQTHTEHGYACIALTSLVAIKAPRTGPPSPTATAEMVVQGVGGGLRHTHLGQPAHTAIFHSAILVKK